MPIIHILVGLDSIISSNLATPRLSASSSLSATPRLSASSSLNASPTLGYRPLSAADPTSNNSNSRRNSTLDCTYTDSDFTKSVLLQLSPMANKRKGPIACNIIISLVETNVQLNKVMNHTRRLSHSTNGSVNFNINESDNENDNHNKSSNNLHNDNYNCNINNNRSNHDDKKNYRELIATITAKDGSFHTSTTLPVKLPTIALIDKDAAEAFVMNLVPKLYFQVAHDWDGNSPKLKMNS